MQNPDLYVSALSLDPAAPSVVYAGTHLGVLKSVDAGQKWSPLRLAPDPNAPPPPTAATASSPRRSTAPTKPSMAGGRNAPNGSPPPESLPRP